MDSSTKICRSCHKITGRSKFSTAKRNKDGLHSYCNPCMTIRGHNRRTEIRKRWKVAQDIIGSEDSRQCARCKEEKTKEYFYRSSHSVSGLRSQCKLCESDVRLLKLYGIDTKGKQELIESQDNKCALCRDYLGETKNTHVDHNHATGEVRGILCYKCNKGLGLFNDDVNKLTEAINYLTTRGSYGGIK